MEGEIQNCYDKGAFQQKNPHARKVAIQGFGRAIRSLEDPTPLINLIRTSMKDSDEEVRQASLKSYWKICDKLETPSKMVSPLLEGLQDTNSVQIAAFEVLQLMGHQVTREDALQLVPVLVKTLETQVQKLVKTSEMNILNLIQKGARALGKIIGHLGEPAKIKAVVLTQGAVSQQINSCGYRIRELQQLHWDLHPHARPVIQALKSRGYTLGLLPSYWNDKPWKPNATEVAKTLGIPLIKCCVKIPNNRYKPRLRTPNLFNFITKEGCDSTEVMVVTSRSDGDKLRDLIIGRISVMISRYLQQFKDLPHLRQIKDIQEILTILGITGPDMN